MPDIYKRIHKQVENVCIAAMFLVSSHTVFGQVSQRFSRAEEALIERKAFEIPNAGYIFVYDIAGSFDGAIALVGTDISNNSQLWTSVARMPPDRKDTIVSRVSPYVPREGNHCGRRQAMGSRMSDG
jgi:hypothetical protein